MVYTLHRQLMFALIFIIGLIIILWPVIGGALASLFNGIVVIVSSPCYWIMRLIKCPRNKEEDDRITKNATETAMGIVITAIFVILIIVFVWQ